MTASVKPAAATVTERRTQRRGPRIARKPTRTAYAPILLYSVSSSRAKTRIVGLNIQLSRSPANNNAANPVARTKPYFGPPMASLTAPIARGASTAERHVKNRSTPAPAPCSDLARQLMPLELMVG